MIIAKVNISTYRNAQSPVKSDYLSCISFKSKFLHSNGDTFDKTYYENGVQTGKSGYQNYHWMPERTIPMCETIKKELGIRNGEKILDYGCAKGYSVKAFRMMGIKAFGFDISDYAIKSAPDDVKQFLSTKLKGKYDYIVAKDVFEHVNYEDIDKLLTILGKKCKKMFCVVPLAKDGKYIIPLCNTDVTHKIKEPLEWWKNTFEKAGFSVEKACHTMENISQQHQKWENGVGIFVLKKAKKLF